MPISVPLALSTNRNTHTQISALLRIFALCIQVILLNEAIILIRSCAWHCTHSIVAASCRNLSRRRFLRNSVACIDPVGVDVNRRAEIVDIGLEGLAADFALQVSDAGLLFDRDRDGLFVVAEEALECRRELLFLLRPLRFAGGFALAHGD